MPKLSAGLLLYRFREGNVEVLLVHPYRSCWIRPPRPDFEIRNHHLNEIVDSGI